MAARVPSNGAAWRAVLLPGDCAARGRVRVRVRVRVRKDQMMCTAGAEQRRRVAGGAAAGRLRGAQGRE